MSSHRILRFGNCDPALVTWSLHRLISGRTIPATKRGRRVPGRAPPLIASALGSRHLRLAGPRHAPLTRENVGQRGGDMQFGRYYEEFEVGAVYRHWPGKTVTESDDHLFCLITMNHHPLHLDANYAQKSTDFGRNVVVGNYVYSLLLGMSVADVSGRAIANL